MLIRFLKNNVTIRLIVLISFFSSSQHLPCIAQNLYDLEQSRKYADYLFSSQQYILAAEEYERLVFMDADNIGFKNKLIRSYRLSGNLKGGINRLYSIYGNSLPAIPEGLAKEFLKLQLLTDSLTSAEKFLQRNNTLSLETKAIGSSCILLLSGEYQKVNLFIGNVSDSKLVLPENLTLLAERAEKTKFKSPFLAGGFSAIIPGTGKMYSKNWSDGIISFLFVAGNAWQAYRGFHEHGVKSAYGWTFASLGATFYIGNIFGSVKAAKSYNNNLKNEIDNQIFEFVRSDRF